MKKVTVKLFASARDLAGGLPFLEIVLDPEVQTVRDLIELLCRRFPDLGPQSARLMAARNQRYASRDALLDDGDEIALFPPVSGG